MKSLENFKALSQRALTPLLQQGFSKARSEPERVSQCFPNVSDGVMAAELLHGEEKVIYGDAGYQGLEKRKEMAGGDVDCRIAMGPGKPPPPA